MKNLKFKTKIWCWRGRVTWYMMSLPRESYEEIRTYYGKGMILVEITINKNVSWETKLLPHTKTKTYLVMIKKQKRELAQIWEGDEVSVQIIFQK